MRAGKRVAILDALGVGVDAIPDIARRTGWSDTVVARTLRWLQEDGIVEVRRTPLGGYRYGARRVA